MNCALQVLPDEKEAFQPLVLESWGQGIRHLKCLVNWMRILHLVSLSFFFFFFNQGNTQSRQWLYQRLSNKYKELPGRRHARRYTASRRMSAADECVWGKPEFALYKV